jgi:hypothetical protein
MRWQRDDASPGIVGISEEVAIRIYGIAEGVKTICRRYGIENLLPMVVNYTLNCRSGNNVERWCGRHDLFS